MKKQIINKKRHCGKNRYLYLRKFVKELLSIEGVEEVFLKYFPLPTTPKLERVINKWFSKMDEGDRQASRKAGNPARLPPSFYLQGVERDDNEQKNKRE